MGSRQSSEAGVAGLVLFGVLALAGCDTQVGVGAEGRGPEKAPLTEMGLIDDHEQPSEMDELGDPILLPNPRPETEAEQPAAADTAAEADTAAAAAAGEGESPAQ